MQTKSTPEDRLIDQWIEMNPHKPGPADAWVRPSYVSVWVIARQLELEEGGAEIVAENYELPVEAVRAAVAYYHRHKTAIDRRIARNRAFFVAL